MKVDNDDSNYWAMEGSVHLIAKAEYTLCGAALEGEDGSEGMPVVPQRITCENCVSVIEYVNTIPRQHYRKRARRGQK